MAITLVQTNNQTANCNTATETIACSGATANGLGPPPFTTAAVGATPGVGSTAINLPAEASNQILDGIDCTINSGVSWDAGTWTIRINCTTSNMNMSISQIHICRIDSNCVNQASLGSATGLSISLGTTGVKTQTVSGSGATPGANDRILIVIVGSNSAMTTQSAEILKDQNIDSPFTAFIPPKLYTINQAVKRASVY